MSKKTYKLSAKNFQSWRGFDLPMTGFTVIIGPSDRGKSAIIRALRGILRNQVGANHITYGEKATEVTLNIDETQIILARNNKTTTYTVGDNEYAKLAGAIPPVVEEMSFNEVEVNGVKLDPIFAGQFDSQFMLNLSPTELNSIFGLFSSTEKLNQGKKNAAAKNLEFNATAKFLASEIQEAEAKKGRLSTLFEDMNEQSQVIFDLENNYNSIVTSFNLLKKLREQQNKCKSLKKIAESSIPDTSSLLAILNTGKTLVQYSKKRKLMNVTRSFVSSDIPSCSSLSRELQIIVQLIKTQKAFRRVKLIRGLPVEPIINILTPISRTIKLFRSYSTSLERIKRYRSVLAHSKISSSLDSVLNCINTLKAYSASLKAIKNYQSSLISSNKQLLEASSQLSELQGNSLQCPKCGHFFTGETHGHE